MFKRRSKNFSGCFGSLPLKVESGRADLSRRKLMKAESPVNLSSSAIISGFRRRSLWCDESGNLRPGQNKGY
jgi:hypothetical protein